MKYLIMALLLAGCNCELKPAKIVSVGGCNRDGLCGVELDNGKFAQDYYPAIGKYVAQYGKCEKGSK